MSRKTTIPVFWVDAFTDRPFAGNPAAVCILDRELAEPLMQNVAAEFGLSETAFVHPADSGWNLRWFTPTAEVRLCGHATIAAATALWEHRDNLASSISFHTLSGELTATKSDKHIELSFPARPPQECPAPASLLKGLGLSQSQLQWCGRDADDYLLLVGSEETIKALKPDFGPLSNIETRGIMVTAKSSTSERDFVSRFFAPKVGVNEDPVTGSAHCCLTPFWSQRLGKTLLKAAQLSSRGGELEVELRDQCVLLRGQSYLLLRGEIQLET